MMLEFAEIKNQTAVEKAAALAGYVWREYYGPILPAGQIDYMLEKFQSPGAIAQQIDQGYRYFFVRDEGAQFGYFAVQKRGREFFISKLYIVDRARRKGVGRTCVSYIEELARAEGCRTLTLTVNRNNADSIEAYKRMGFYVSGEGIVDIGGGYRMDDYYMMKDID